MEEPTQLRFETFSQALQGRRGPFRMDSYHV
jgi:hypothetical protein